MENEEYKPRWTILSIEYDPHVHTYDVIVTTDIKVHMWMEWSFGYRSVVVSWRVTRGLAMRCYPQYHFMTTSAIEQEEAGDTLIHTFKISYMDFKRNYVTRLIATIEGFPTPCHSPYCVAPYFPEGSSTLSIRANLDTFLNRRYPDTNYGSQTYLILEGRYTGNRQANILMHFPKPTLPEGATIVDAILTLFWNGNSGNPLPATLYRCLQPTWEEGTTTWLWYAWPSTWDTPGGDYAPLYPLPVDSSTDWWVYPYKVTWALTSHIQPYFMNDWPLDFLMIPREGWRWMRFYSDEYHIPAKRPKLELTYAIIKNNPH